MLSIKMYEGNHEIPSWIMPITALKQTVSFFTGGGIILGRCQKDIPPNRNDTTYRLKMIPRRPLLLFILATILQGYPNNHLNNTHRQEPSLKIHYYRTLVRLMQ